MSNQDLIERPSLDFEVKAEIKSLGMIEDNISEVKEKVIKLNEYYKNITFTEDTMKQATEEKANVNKFKKAVADYRKNIIAEYKKPIEIFENTAKETEKILDDTYKTINEQVENYNNQKKEKIREENEQYFNEYLQSKNIDFVTYKQANINITLNSSKKNLQEQAKTFIDKIVDDLNLIETQEHKAEILVEYKQNLNVSQAITTVTNRFKAIEEEKKKQEELKERLYQQMSEEADKAIRISKKDKELINDFIDRAVERDTVLQAPVVEEKQEDILTLKFIVKATRTKLKELKEFLESGGYDYE